MNKNEEINLLKEENRRLKKLLKIQNQENKETISIEELVDMKKLEDIFLKFSKLTGYTTGFVKQDTREVLVSTGWTDICKTYHRGSNSSAYICQESNAELTQGLKQSHQVMIKQCQHGMVDGATPIMIDGEHLADLFSGQVLFHKPNIEDFKRGANEFGYDTQAYLKALEDVKVISENKLKEVLDFLASVAKIIAEIGKEKKEYLNLNATLEKRIDERVKETNSLLTLFNKGENVLFKWNNDKEWSVAFVSLSVAKLMGYTKEEFENNQIQYSKTIHKDDITQVMNEVQLAKEQDKDFFLHKPYRIITKTGEIKWILDNTVIMRDEHGEISHFLGYLSDFTTFKNYQEKLEYLSQTDQLTKVKNRLYTDETLQKQYYRFIRNSEECSVILLDIDHFKLINDNYGHIAGDLFLIEFSNILSTHIRTSDIVGRWGGEEFLIISPHTTLEDALKLATKLKNLIEKFNFTKVGSRTASFGISNFTIGITVEKLLDNADKALYISKENGRNQINCFKEKDV